MPNNKEVIFHMKTTTITNSKYYSIRQRLYLWKNMIYCWNIEIGMKVLRNKYCRLGFHSVTSETSIFMIENKKTTIRYLKCAYCKFMFFTSKSQKKKYVKLENQFNNTTKEVFSALSRDSSSTTPKV